MPHPEQPLTRKDARRAASAPTPDVGALRSAPRRGVGDAPRGASAAAPSASRAASGRSVEQMFARLAQRLAALPPAGRWGVVLGAVLLVAALTVAVVVAFTPRAETPPATAAALSAPNDPVSLPADAPAAAPATGIPAPAQTAIATTSCDAPGVVAALGGGTDADVIAAFGGAAAFRAAVAAGTAPCVNLADARHIWVVVDKQRPLDPLDFEPATVIAPADMPRTVDGRLVPDAANALTALVAAASAEGVGSIGLNSAYRSFASQTGTYNGYVGSLGRDQADLQSARPGYSEHQTGLATDVAACDGGCGAIEDFGGTPQGAWTAANAWRFGFIVRYEQGATAVTGYEAEPWHLRYIGPELAQLYHEGGYHTLEDFFGLPAAPGY